MSDNIKFLFLSSSLIINGGLALSFINETLFFYKKWSKSKLQKLIDIDELPILLNKMEMVDESKDEVKMGFFFLRGLTNTNEPVASTLGAPSVKLIYKEIYREDIYSNDIHNNEFEKKKQRCISRESTNFLLVSEDNKSSCKVHRKTVIDTIDCLESIGIKESRKEMNVMQKILASIYLIFSFASVFKQYFIDFKGVKIGFSEEEFGIKIGTPLTVLGEIVYNKKDKVFKMANPLGFMRGKNSYLLALEKKLTAKVAGSVFFTTLFAISAFFLFPIAKKKYINHNNSKRKNQQLNKMMSIYNVFVVPKDFKCEICKIKNCVIVFKPCMHVMYCKECYDGSKVSSCPSCNGAIQETAEIFLP